MGRGLHARASVTRDACHARGIHALGEQATGRVEITGLRTRSDFGSLPATWRARSCHRGRRSRMPMNRRHCRPGWGTGVNRHDSVVFGELVDALPPIAGKLGRPRRWPDRRHADKAYDVERCRAHLKRRAFTAASPAKVASAMTGWGDIAGWWRPLMPGSRAWASCASVSNAGPIYIHLALLSLACPGIRLRHPAGFGEPLLKSRQATP